MKTNQSDLYSAHFSGLRKKYSTEYLRVGLDNSPFWFVLFTSPLAQVNRSGVGPCIYVMAKAAGSEGPEYKLTRLSV